MENKYRDIGRVANSQEARSSVLVRGSDGLFYFVIMSQGFVFTVNLNKKTGRAYPFPEGYKAYPYGSMGSKTGKVYFGAGEMFYEFDPVVGEYTFSANVKPENASWGAEALAPSEAEDGMIYFGACPITHLMSFNPKTRELTEYGVMDEDEEYLTSQVADKDGWIYCGIGTRKPKIIAFNLETREKRIIAETDEAGYNPEIRLATNGEIYGALEGSSHGCEYRAYKSWYRLSGGNLCERREKPFKNYYIGEGFDAIHCPLEEHPEIIEQDLVEHELTYKHPETGEVVTISLDYEVEGADLSPITLGPDGKIYGTTNHPIQIFTYDPKTDELINYGRRPFKKDIEELGGRGGWGNICAYASQGNILAGPAYCGGFIVRIDVTQPIRGDVDDINPHCEGFSFEIYRPRSAAAMPDGKTMVFGGFNLNGRPGGGLVVYDSAARTFKVIENEKLRCGHSTMAIVPMSGSRILCGTNIDSPCGGKATVTEAEIFEYDIEKEQVIYSLVPMPGAKGIEHMKQDASGIIHGITLEGVYFAYDAQARKVLRSQDLSKYGIPVRDGMCIDCDGTIYGLLTRGIYRIAFGKEFAEIISEPPCDIERGMAICDGKIYFGNLTHLWSYTIF